MFAFCAKAEALYSAAVERGCGLHGVCHCVRSVDAINRLLSQLRIEIIRTCDRKGSLTPAFSCSLSPDTLFSFSPSLSSGFGSLISFFLHLWRRTLGLTWWSAVVFDWDYECAVGAQLKWTAGFGSPDYSWRSSKLLLCVNDRQFLFIFQRCAWWQTGRLQERLPTKLAANAHTLHWWDSFCLSRTCQLNLPSQRAMYGHMERLMGNELTSRSPLRKEVLFYRKKPVWNPHHVKPDPHPSGYSFCFLMSNLAPYYIIHCYVNESFSDVHLCLSGDDTESAYREKKVSLVLWGISTQLAGGWKAIAKDSIGFKVSLCSWILPYPIHTAGSVWFSGLYRLRCLCLGRAPHPTLSTAPCIHVKVPAAFLQQGKVKHVYMLVSHCQQVLCIIARNTAEEGWDHFSHQPCCECSCFFSWSHSFSSCCVLILH